MVAGPAGLFIFKLANYWGHGKIEKLMIWPSNSTLESLQVTFYLFCSINKMTNKSLTWKKKYHLKSQMEYIYKFEISIVGWIKFYRYLLIWSVFIYIDKYLYTLIKYFLSREFSSIDRIIVCEGSNLGHPTYSL
jgi:hypothetical protein